MTEGVELFRGIGPGAEDFSHLPVALGVFVCAHVADGVRPACQVNIENGDVSAVCEDGACFDDDPQVTAFYRVLHFAPDLGALGPARDGWSFARRSPADRWMAWAPGADDPVPADRRHDA